MEKMEVSERNAVIIALSALYLTQPYFSAFTTTPNNWREELMGQVPTLRTLFRRKETTIKRGQRETGGRGLKPLSYQRLQKKLFRPYRRPIFFGKLSSSQLDRKEHHDNCCPYTKTQLFDPFSTNSLYRTHWSKVPYILGLGAEKCDPTINI